MHLPFDLVTPLLEIYPEEIYYHKCKTTYRKLPIAI